MSLFGQSSQSSSTATTTQPKPLFGLTATTPSQPQSSPSLFGATTNTSSQPQSGGLFGSASSQPQSSSLFGATTQAQPAGSLFSSTTNASQTPKPLFGSVTTTQPQQTSGLFGSAATTTATQPQSGGLFGAASTTTTSQPQSSGLFGAAATSQPQSGGLFGAATTSQAQSSKSLFGESTAQAVPGGSLFGNTQNQQKPSLFGNSMQQPATSSLFGGPSRPGGLTMGQSTTQPQQQTVPAVKIDVSNIRGTTRFNELHEDIQKQIEQIDAFIQQQIQFKEQCDAIVPAHQSNLSTLPADVEYLSSRLETAELTVENDTTAVANVKNLVQTDADNARIGFRAAENLKLPQQFHYSGVWQNISSQTMSPPRLVGSSENSSEYKTDLLGFFNSSASSLSETLDRYGRNLSEIENHLNVVEANINLQAQQLMLRRGKEGAARSKDDQVRELGGVLRDFEGAIVGAAERVGKLREDVVNVIEGEASGAAWR